MSASSASRRDERRRVAAMHHGGEGAIMRRWGTPSRNSPWKHGFRDALSQSNLRARRNHDRDLIGNVMFPTIQACQDTEVYLGANRSAKANPADAALQRHVQAVKKEPDLAEVALESLEFEHGFVNPPSPPLMMPRLPVSNALTPTTRSFILIL
jgi:hypothetical protein